MVKKSVSYVIIWSLLSANNAFCGQGASKKIQLPEDPPSEKTPLRQNKQIQGDDTSKSPPSHSSDFPDSDPDPTGTNSSVQDNITVDNPSSSFSEFNALDPTLSLNNARLSLHSQLGISPHDAKLLQQYLKTFKLSSNDFFSEESTKALANILAIEQTWRNALIWLNIYTDPKRLIFALTTSKNAIKGREKTPCCEPFWIHGGPFSLDRSVDVKKSYLLDATEGGLIDGIVDSVHASLSALLLYQAYRVLDSGEFSPSFSAIKNFFGKADEVSYQGIILALNKHPALFAIISVPFIYALITAGVSYFLIPEPTESEVGKIVTRLKETSSKWDGKFVNGLSLVPGISSLLSLNAVKRNVPSLTQLILWDGRLSTEAREQAVDEIITLAKERKGLSQMAALESLALLSHGLHTTDLHLRSHSDAESLLKIKLKAFTALQDIYKKLPNTSLNKLKTAILLWEMGQSPSRVISVIEPLIKLVRAALYINTLYGIFGVLKGYINCPAKYQNNFSWAGGLAPYASDYSENCFTAQVKAFNTIPGQPAWTLVKDLKHYRFNNSRYDLNLSNKWINGSVIAEIVEAFKNAENVQLSSLDMSKNNVPNPSDLQRILRALPPQLIMLDISNIAYDGHSLDQPSIFLELGRLKGLQNLTLSNDINYNDNNNQFSSEDIGAVGEALQTLPSLKELRLNGEMGGGNNTNISKIAHAFKPSWTLLDLSSFNLPDDIQGQIDPLIR